jgi:hypothetical protein
MGVSSFPPVDGGDTAAPFDVYFCSAGTSQINYSGLAGIYTIKAFKEDWSSSLSATVTLVGETGDSVGGGNLYDSDTGSTNNLVEIQLRATDSVAKVVISSDLDGFVSIEFNNAYQEFNPITTTVYSTSQDITFAEATNGVIIGGGGGGSMGAYYYGGGSGGSGYLTQVSITAGTYSLVAGAGGAGSATEFGTGGTGGTTTLLGESALGGIGGAGYDGGAGGSGGGAQTSTTGGINGGNGGGGALGSGVVLPFFQAPDAAAGNSQGGGIYGGGGGSSNRTAGGGGGVVAGADGGAVSGSAGAGGAGGLIVLNGA